MEDVVKVKLSYDKVLKTIQEKVDWIERQCGATLATMERCFENGFKGVIDYIVEKGKEKMRDSHHELVRIYREDKLVEILI